MLKRIVARLLLFGVPFALSYWMSRPTPPAPGQPFTVCAYPGNLPGELRISLDTASCRERTGSQQEAVDARTIPTRRTPSHDDTKDGPVTLPF